MNPSSGSVQPVAFPVDFIGGGREREPVACGTSACERARRARAGRTRRSLRRVRCGTGDRGSDDRGRGLARVTANPRGGGGTRRGRRCARGSVPAALDALAAEITGPRLLFGQRHPAPPSHSTTPSRIRHPSRLSSSARRRCGPRPRSGGRSRPAACCGSSRRTSVSRTVCQSRHSRGTVRSSRSFEPTRSSKDRLARSSTSIWWTHNAASSPGAGSLSVPTLLSAGTADQIVDWTGARDVAAAAQSGRARFVPVEGAFHELLNDGGRDEVVGLILEFWKPQLKRRSRPGGVRVSRLGASVVSGKPESGSRSGSPGPRRARTADRPSGRSSGEAHS